MTTVNKKRRVTLREQKRKKEMHVNFMGAPSYDISDPILRLICVSASAFFGEPSYYKGKGAERTWLHRASGRRFLDRSLVKHLRDTLNAIDDYEWRNLTPAETMVRAIREALAYNIEETLHWAVHLRNVENIRVTPQIILVEAANSKKAKGTGIIRHFGRKIILRADEPATQLAYQLSEFGKPIPNSLKRAWSDYFKNCSDYELAKYRMEKRIVKTVDVGNLAYGKGFYGYDTPIGKLMRGELKLGEGRKTWESIISSGGSWEEAIKVMGHMALLRNIRNLTQNGVDPRLWLDKLVSGAEKGRQLPFRYLTAYLIARQEGMSGNILDAIEECLELSIGNLPRLKGRSLILTDNSGSAHGCPISSMSSMSVAQIGNLMGVLTGKFLTMVWLACSATD